MGLKQFGKLNHANRWALNKRALKLSKPVLAADESTLRFAFKEVKIEIGRFLVEFMN